MAYLVKPYTPPFKCLIFNYNTALSTATILYNDTNYNWAIDNPGTGQLSIDCGAIILEQNQYCVIVTPIRLGNNHSINVGSDPSINNVINVYCTENQNNTLTNDGFNLTTFQINFFNL